MRLKKTKALGWRDNMKEGERIKKRLKALECILHIFFDMAHPCWLPSCSDSHLSVIFKYPISSYIQTKPQLFWFINFSLWFMMWGLTFAGPEDPMIDYCIWKRATTKKISFKMLCSLHWNLSNIFRVIYSP